MTFGGPVAIVSALRPNSFGDNISRFLSILFLAIPGFWLAMLIVGASGALVAGVRRRVSG